ncbi:peptide chain release factor 2 [Terrihabitans rhizophilus]|uniref:Peptide chain release factor 2 n=1 Tax=Terrihabitans rhizophilus TaxID=3092662 RepID=A0ABU4RKQ2_9HYPH|nr:peptide chain release factor 2 [Terrihabitans sp. PJ23]MDX6805417.1 peptide chain release factor 2 [Terrihabitans sp. PJ23]
MRAETANLVEELKQSVGLLRRHLDWDQANSRLRELNALSEDPTLWDDADRAQKLMRERTDLESRIDAILRFDRELADSIELIELGEAEGDESVIDEADAVIRGLRDEAARQQIETLLSGEADENDTYVDIHPGAGGTESQDWAEMLLRMYTRWAERRGYKVDLVDYQSGEGAGIKSATMQVKGKNAYGWLKTESGVHRLVRISPFDSAARRQTSFASIDVYPVIDDRIQIDIDESQVRVDTMRSGGAGGQHVNKTESAVRLTHLPTGIAVVSEGDRSQHKNRATAWNMLRAKLYERELKKREEAAAAEQAARTDIGWGHQIRSYVLQPYQMVKDLRTGVTSTSPGDVLDGALDPYMEAALAQRVYGGGPANVDDVD